MKNIYILIFSTLFLISCKEKAPTLQMKDDEQKSSVFFTDIIIGNYVVKNETSAPHTCDLNIHITQLNGNYFYELKSKNRTINGELNLQMDAKSQNTYLTFKGIEWEYYDDRYSDTSPTSIEALLKDNEITIQNYGNAMNDYLKLGDCIYKYIVLDKEKH